MGIGLAAGKVVRAERGRLVKGGQVFHSVEAGQDAAKTRGSCDPTDVLVQHREPVALILVDHDLIGVRGRLRPRMMEGVGGGRPILLGGAGHDNARIDRPRRFELLLAQSLGRSGPPPPSQESR